MKNDGGTEHRDQPVPAAQDAVPTASADIDSPRAQDLDAIMPHGATTAPGRYGKAHEYARGGIGRILLVHDQYLDRDIAMKELLSATGPDAATMDQGESPSSARVIRFLREARVTGQLEHPSIVPVHELGHRPQDGHTASRRSRRTFGSLLRREARTPMGNGSHLSPRQPASRIRSREPHHSRCGQWRAQPPQADGKPAFRPCPDSSHTRCRSARIPDRGVGRGRSAETQIDTSAPHPPAPNDRQRHQ